MIVCTHPPAKFTIGDKTYISPVLGVGWLEVDVDIDLQQFHSTPAPAKSPPPKQARIKSSDGTKTYVLSTWPDGIMSCTCPGFTFRKTCKHIMNSRIVTDGLALTLGAPLTLSSPSAWAISTTRRLASASVV